MQRYQRRQLLQEFQRREFHAGCPVRPRFCERVHKVSIGSLLQTLQCHGASRRVPNQAFQLVPSIHWYLDVGVQRKPVDNDTAGARECGAFSFIVERQYKQACYLTVDVVVTREKSVGDTMP
jgi:hypothetical protein